MAGKQPTKSAANPAAVKTESSPSDHGDVPAASLEEAKSRVMIAVPYIRKRGEMKGSGNYKFARDTDVIAFLRGPMADNGLVLTGPKEIKNDTFGQIVISGERKMFHSRALFMFQLKHWPTGQTEDVWVIGEGADSLDKSSNKCMSAARKYALMIGFNLTTGDDPDAFDDEGNQSSGRAEDEDGRPSRPRDTKPVTAAKTEGKKEEKKKEQSNGLPSDGKELHLRLSQYDAKLAAEKVCVRGELLSGVVREGVKIGYGADMTTWDGAAILFAVEQVKTLETEFRAARDKERVEKEALEKVAKESAAPVPQPAAQPEPAKPVDPPAQAAAPSDATNTNPPVPAQVLTPDERFTKRIGVMNASKKLVTLDACRGLYSKDPEMTSAHKAGLEKCYWESVKRVKDADAALARANAAKKS